MSRILFSLFVSTLTISSFGAGQQPAAPSTPARTRAIGQVTAIDKNAKQLTVHSDAGSDLKITVDDGTSFLRAAPGQRDLRSAPHIPFGEINAGDRVIVAGVIGEEQKTIAARTIVVMSKDDVARKQATDREEWDRGVSGVVKTLDPEKKMVTVTVRGGFGGGREVAILADKATLRRYAPDSVKFSEAKPSTFAEVKAGDQVRARGKSSEDNLQFTADEIVSGTFHHMAATIKSIDAATGTLVVTDLDAKKPVTVHTNADSTLRKMPEQMAQFLAMLLQGGGGPGGGSPGGAGRGGFAGRSAGGAGGPGGPGGAGGRGGMQQMMDRIPAITLAELKPGDAVIVASTTGSKPDEVTAITMIAGVEPILTAPNRQMMLGNWNLDMNMGGS
ncbi:MAG: DUF5666 domain-containing protein [Acidobacteria bacterium]|nr:DUF5666 domain-containing protein [Acidobacteriota bacterium]